MQHVISFCAAFVLLATSGWADDIRVLFLGDNGHHRPVDHFHELAPALETHGIELLYTDKMSDLTPETLSEFDGLMLYANIDTISEAQADTVLEYVESGHGFIPLHCATYCWRNSREMVQLMGAQFLRHGAGVFTTEIAAADHPIMQGRDSFSSWDESYIHHMHNEENRTVLEYRREGEQAEGKTREPWTWVRRQGKGRVFYTAWGHDTRTFTHPGFQNLVARGTLWACGRSPSSVAPYKDPGRFDVPRMTALPEGTPPFEYVDVGPKIPNYTPGDRWGVQGDAQSRMQQPLSPADSMTRMVVPEGMAVRLYADESSFDAKPIAMTWDERGRLWVCETVDYPNELGTNRDRIRICEDTDGDHVADRFTVFAEGLSIPTAIVIYRGGAVVQNASETLYLKDTDGDDVADLKQTLITGWAVGDTHGGVSNFRYGMDNWIWAMQGYNNSRPRYGDTEAQSFRMGFWRFRLSNSDPPKVVDLEFVRSTDNNTWGLGLTEEGLVFGSTANHNPSVFMPIPNRYFERVRGWAPSSIGTIADSHLFQPITKNVRQVDQFGGYTAGAGHSIYTARSFPQQWWNRTAFVCGPTGHLVGTFVLRPDGAGYQSTSPTNLLASDDEWCAPIMAETGPDGAVWVIDWYNFIVQHNPTPRGFETGRGNAYESDLRDKRHGRVYRIVPTSPFSDALHAFSDLSEASHAELVETLRHPSMRWRLHAQRLLIERSATDVVEELIALLDDPSVDAIGLNPGAMHALQTLDGLGVIAADENVMAAVRRGLLHPSAGVRRNAALVLPQVESGLAALLSPARDDVPPVEDSDPQVRLAALLRLSDMPESDDAGRALAGIIRKPADAILQEAVTAAAATHATAFLRAVSVSEQAAGSTEQPREQLLQTCRIVAEHLSRGRMDPAQLRNVLVGIEGAPPALATATLQGLLAGWPANHRPVATESLDQTFLKIVDRLDTSSQGLLLQVASNCRSEALQKYTQSIVTTLLDEALDDDADERERLRAMREAVAFLPEDAEIAAQILEVVTPQTSPEFASRVVDAVGQSTAEESSQALAELAASQSPLVRQAIVRVLLRRPESTRVLLEALQTGQIAVSDLALDQRQALRVHPDRSIRDAAVTMLASSGGLPDPDREKVLQSLTEICHETGDVTSGRAMFTKHCSRCHRHGSEGKNIGPDLTGMAVHPKEELLTHIIDPSRSVEGNFRIYTVVRTDGLIVNGMMTSESRTSVTLVDTEAKQHDVPRDDIEELISSRKSLMPEGFEKQMTRKELGDLLEFLTAKGKFLPISLDRYATAISTKGLFHDGDNGPDRLVLSDWSQRVSHGVPFVLTDPLGKTRPNIILLNGPRGTMPPGMPRSVRLPCNSVASHVHLLSGVGGWNWPAERSESTSMIVRLNYQDGEREDHELINGVHFADYIRRVDVPESRLAFMAGGQQMRQLSVEPMRDAVIESIDLIKGNDPTAPIVLAVTVERPE